MLALKKGLVMAWCLSACAPAPADPPDGATLSLMELDQFDLRDGRGVYKSTRAGVTVEVPFDIDLANLNPARRHDSARIGQTEDGVIVLLDRYASKAEPDGRCANGIESFVRAFSLSARKELVEIPAESCLRGNTGPNATIAWLAPDGFQVGERRYSIRGQQVEALKP